MPLTNFDYFLWVMVVSAQKKAADREFVFSDKDFNFLADLVGKKTGIVLSQSKKNMIYGRIARRLRALNFKTFKEYCDYLTGHDGDKEVTDFVNAVTTNLTKFFRESHHFDHLRDEVFKPMVLNPPVGKRFRLWSAGCSSGMEAYSIAMTACDNISGIDGWDFRILATDIDTNMLDKGSNAKYRFRDVEDGVPLPFRKKYVIRSKDKESDEVVLADRVRKLVSFKHLNLLEPWPLKGPFDVIFCRNVVIYFNKDTQRVLFDRYADVLKDGGYLYIGHSESLNGVTDRFKAIGKTIYQKIK